jgi:hypothetical protein
MTLWEREYKQSAGAVSWIYHIKPDFEYADMLKKTMLQVIKDVQSGAESINSKIQATSNRQGTGVIDQPPRTE